MSHEVAAGCDQLRRLVDGRIDAMHLSEWHLNTYRAIPPTRFDAEMKRARSGFERIAIGLIWADQLVALACTAYDLDAALFRFAHNLRAAAANGITPSRHRKPLSVAAWHAFQRLRNTPPEHKGTCPALLPEDQGRWYDALGVPEADWLDAIEAVGSALAESRAEPVAKRSAVRTLPRWLSPTVPLHGPNHLGDLAPWRCPDEDHAPSLEDVAKSATSAYEELVSGRYSAAATAVEPVQRAMGATWNPTESADGRAFYAWLRAVPLVASVVDGDHSLTDHHALSALALLKRVPDDGLNEVRDELLESILTEPTGDPAADLDWAVLRHRLCRVLGHEVALEDLDNPTKARLRQLWQKAFPALRLEATTTIEMIRALDGPLDDALAVLRDRAQVPSRAVARALEALRAYSDGPEREILKRVGATVEAHLVGLGGLDSMQLLRVSRRELVVAADAVRASGSLHLQEACLPLLAQLRHQVDEMIERLGAAGGPEPTFLLVSDRLPLLLPEGTELTVEIVVRNEGTMAARNLAVLLVAGAGIEFPDQPVVVGVVPAGAERRVCIPGHVLAPSRAVSFDGHATWDDDYDREGRATERFHAEAQRPSRWTDADRNPFQLSSIQDPDRLIGRQDYLRRLLDIARSGGSMYVTGLKRVGKTSLVRVGLRLLENEGHVAVYLPLGRALGRSAADLIGSMLGKLGDAIEETFPELELPEMDVTEHQVNFARAADRWLTRVRRRLPAGTSATIALDDFDELPSGLRSGEQGDAFFLFLRSLIDEEWLSLVFVGSEVLPTLLAQQSQRLNQVDPMQVDNFGSRGATADLLQLPSGDRIDWSDAAIDTVHMLAGGNPYYSTIIGSRVWTALRERGRTLVQQSDVDQAAESVALTENQSHFLHLWSDDPEGLDAASPRAVQSSAVLRAIARCSPSPGGLAAREDVIAASQHWIPAATHDQLQAACTSLVRRGIVDEADDGLLRLHLPIVGKWLMAAGGRYLDNLYRDSPFGSTAPKLITAADYKRLARNLTYQSRDMSAIDLEGWVDQLPDPAHQHLAFQLLQRAVTKGFFSHDRILREVVPALGAALRSGPFRGRAHRDNYGYVRNVLLVDHGIAGSSGPAFLRPMMTELRLTKPTIAGLSEVANRYSAERPRIILLVDEFAGSGDQMSRLVDEVATHLTGADPRWADGTTIVVAIGVVPGDEVASLLAERRCEVVTGLTLGPEVRAFDRRAQIFDKETDRQAALDLFAAIGRSIQHQGPLGFAGEGLLVVFESNCPDNSLPALWQEGTYAGRSWIPVFPRFGTPEQSLRAI